jgi:hydrogenase nickel incorporation protein HypA/HybF
MMHELAIVHGIVESVTERSGGGRILRIVLEIGELATVLPEALRFCFALAAEGTLAEGATLDILRIEGLARCLQCGAQTPMPRPYGQCPCGSTNLEFLRGDELRIKEMEVA